MKIILFLILGLSRMIFKMVDEAQNSNPSPFLCENDSHCDGSRTCSKGKFCIGIPRIESKCLNNDYKQEENSQHTCKTDCDCSGKKLQYFKIK